MTPAPESPDAALVERLRADVQGINLGADGMGWSPNPGILEQAADTITRLTAERDAARRDAERYAGLRAKHAQELCDFIYGQTVPCDLPADWGRELDEWVDAENSTALSAQERGNV